MIARCGCVLCWGIVASPGSAGLLVKKLHGYSDGCTHIGVIIR